MNHIYRIVWNTISACWQVVGEATKSHGKSHSRKRVARAGALAAGCLLGMPAWAGPTGGQVTAGSATIAQSGSATTINQSSQNAAINWQRFSVGKAESVQFNQPNASAITLNRVTGAESSQILGSLTANGRVFILNPNGVLIGNGAQVNVGGIVASTGQMSNADFMAGNYKITGATGSVINEGSINAAQGGVVALIAPVVQNSGTIAAPQGSVLLAGAQAVTLKLQDGSLVGYTLDQGSLQALADNGGLIQADGGHVVLTAKGLDALSKATVNHSGIIEAQTVSNKNGVVELLGDMEVGQVNLSGRIDASAPNGGDGGFVETSAAKVKVADSARIDTRAPQGRTGTWLLDPKDLTIRSEGGDMTGAAVASQLSSTNVTLTSAQGATEGQGDIRVQDSITWAANTTLTLTAEGQILIEAPITGTGDHAGVVLNPSQDGGGYDQYIVNPLGRGTINLPGANATFVVNGQSFTLIHNLTELQALKDVGGNGYYALANDIDATATATWNGGAGFEPIYAGGSNYLRLDGLGHSINNLTINRPGQDDVGLFSWSSGLIRELKLENVNITGGSAVGGIAGDLVSNFGSVGIRYSMITGSVSGQGQVGGAVGRNSTVIDGVGSSATVTGAAGYGYVGGLVGSNAGSIRYSFASGQVTSGGGMTSGGGGLVGYNAGYISDSYATGNVTTLGWVDGNPFGGLVGSQSSGHISNNYATGRIIVAAGGGTPVVGGLVGADLSGDSTVDSSYYDTQTTRVSTSAGGVGRTTTEMQNPSTYVGWNFGWPWRTPGGASYPQLEWAAPKTNTNVPEQEDTISFSAKPPEDTGTLIAGAKYVADSGAVTTNAPNQLNTQAHTYSETFFFGKNTWAGSFGYLVDGYTITSGSDGAVSLSLPLYNNRSIYVAIEVLDASGNVVSTALADPNQLDTSITDYWGRQFSSFFDGKTGFTDGAISTRTDISIEIPRGGSVRMGYGYPEAMAANLIDSGLDFVSSFLPNFVPKSGGPYKVAYRAFVTEFIKAGGINLVQDLATGKIESTQFMQGLVDLVGSDAALGNAFNALFSATSVVADDARTVLGRQLKAAGGSITALAEGGGILLSGLNLVDALRAAGTDQSAYNGSLTFTW